MKNYKQKKKIEIYKRVCKIDSVSESPESSSDR